MDPVKNRSSGNSLVSIINPYSLAGGLMYGDRFILPLLLVLLCATSVVSGVLDPASPLQTWTLLIAERSAQIFAMAFVAHRWRGRLLSPSGPRASFSKVFAKTAVVGFGLWAMTMAPLALLSYIEEPAVVALVTVSATIALIFAIRLFFYFAVIGLTPSSIPESLRAARGLTLKEPSAPIRSIVGPLAFTALLVAILSAPYPDGRSLAWATAASAAEGVFWLLSTYVALAFTVLLLDESSWASSGLDPYRIERLQTLETQGRGKVSALLSSRVGFKILLLAFLVFIGNVSRQVSEVPAAEIHLKTVEIGEHIVRVALEIEDPTYHYRGFRPIAFLLAGESGTPVASALTRAALAPDAQERLLSLDPALGRATLYLEFKVDRSAADIRRLEDLWVWYQLKAIIHLKKEILAAAPNIELPPQVIPPTPTPSEVSLQQSA